MGSVIQEVRGVCEVARYVHSNPVRILGLGLGKAEQRRAKVVGNVCSGWRRTRLDSGSWLGCAVG